MRVRYFGQDRDALEGVDVSVPEGSVVGVAGANGAGKSTLALVAAGFIPRLVRARFEGHVRLAGRLPTDPAAGPSDRVGMVFPEPANQLSASKTTVRDELAFGLENLGTPREEMDERIDAALDTLRIGHLADRYPYALSGGEQQRVAIASMLVMRPAALVLDEPAAQLDPAGGELVASLLGTLAGDGRAVLVTEHDPAVLAVTSACVVLGDGHVVATGDPAAALGSREAGAAGLDTPPGVVVAQRLGLPLAAGFELERLARAVGGTAAVAPARPKQDRALTWAPVVDQRPMVLRVRSLTHRYRGGARAIEGLDLSFEPGERVAIIGQNGSGKTTLAKHLNGLLRPTEGTVELDGNDIRGTPVHELAASVGFVFQDPSDQLFARTVERELAFGPRNLRLPAEAVDRLVGRAMEAVGLTGSAGLSPYDLGASRRKLVALASVLAMDPAVLILDEPTTGQDALGRRRVAAVVRAWGAVGRTVIAVTHDMDLAAQHFTRVIVMREGRVLLDGSPAEVFTATNEQTLATTGLRLPLVARIAAAAGWPPPLPFSVDALVPAGGETCP